MKTCYSSKFYRDLSDGSFKSALEVVPILISLFKPVSVLDVGCGIGTWLRVFADYGVEDIRGVDGDYVNRSQMMIPEDVFMPFNLSEPLRLNRKFDLALSLEVAEHLPEEKADTIVETLVSHAPVILFSASIPFQGGTNHINEQWQSYWAKKFISKGYLPSKYLRDKIWYLSNIEPWYKQNIMLYIDINYIDHVSDKINIEANTSILDVVHPEFYEKYANPRKLKTGILRIVFSGLPRLLKQILYKQIGNKIQHYC